jgi:hypothetical protein
VSVNIQEIHVRGLGAEPSADGQLLRLTIDGTKGEVIHAILQAHGLVPLAGVLLKVGVDETVRAVTRVPSRVASIEESLGFS